MGAATIGYPGMGLAFEMKDCNVFNRTGATLAVGDVVMFDLGDTVAGTTTTTNLGAAGSIFSNVILPATAGIGAVASAQRFFFGCVVSLYDGSPAGTTPGADNAIVRVRVQGPCQIKTTGAVDIGDRLQPANGVSTVDDTTVAGVMYVAIARETAAGAATIACIFDGIYGFGASFAS